MFTKYHTIIKIYKVYKESKIEILGFSIFNIWYLVHMELLIHPSFISFLSCPQLDVYHFVHKKTHCFSVIYMCLYTVDLKDKTGYKRTVNVCNRTPFASVLKMKTWVAIWIIIRLISKCNNTHNWACAARSICMYVLVECIFHVLLLSLVTGEMNWFCVFI